jgi:hypothetical protein
MRTDFAERARAHVGTRFRPQGRDPRFGLDGVGLILCTFGLPADAVRKDYRLRGEHRDELLVELERRFRRVPRSRIRPGDVLLLSVASDQLHLGIATGEGLIHADAKLGKVVEAPKLPCWPVVAAFRRRVRESAS